MDTSHPHTPSPYYWINFWLNQCSVLTVFWPYKLFLQLSREVCYDYFSFLHTLLFALFSRGLSPNSHPNSLLNMLTNEVFNLAFSESILELSELLLSGLVDLWDCSRAALKYVPTRTAGIPSTPSLNVEPPFFYATFSFLLSLFPYFWWSTKFRS